MKKYNRLLATLYCTYCITMITGCGMYIRSPDDFPASLRIMELITINVNNAITTELQRTLLAAHVALNNHIAPFTLTLHDSRMETDMPIVFNANAATVYTYHFSVGLILSDAHNNKIIDTTVSAMENVTNNVNQVSPPVFTPLMRRTLTQQLVNNIYSVLTSETTQKAIHEARIPTSQR